MKSGQASTFCLAFCFFLALTSATETTAETTTETTAKTTFETTTETPYETTTITTPGTIPKQERWIIPVGVGTGIIVLIAFAYFFRKYCHPPQGTALSQSPQDSTPNYKTISGTTTDSSGLPIKQEQPQRHLREGQRAIGICGTWKGGKSSLINGLMGIANSDPRAAFVDQCLETTTEELYEVDEKTVLIELPHTDQEEETPENYFENHRLDQFNLLVFVTGEMVRKKDIEIASIARQNNIDCIFVRSACDRDLKPILDDSEEQDAKKKRLKESGLEKYLPDIEKYSALKGVKCYFVSSCCFYENSSPTNKRAFGLDEDELKKTIFGC